MMWGSKWVLGTLLTKENMLADAFGNVLLRVGATESEAQISAIGAILKNINANKLGLVIVGVVCIGIVGYHIVHKNRIQIKSINWCVVGCAILPIVWYFVVSNHSYIHYWFTYRVLAISVYAGLLLVASVFKTNNRG